MAKFKVLNRTIRATSFMLCFAIVAGCANSAKYPGLDGTCTHRSAIAEILASHDEKFITAEATVGGNALERWEGEATWTLISTRADAISCIVDAGYLNAPQELGAVDGSRA